MKTVVEKLIEKMSLEDVCKYSNELAEAKEMEKEQREKTLKFAEHISGLTISNYKSDGLWYVNRCFRTTSQLFNDFEKHYNKTYNSERIESIK